MKLKYIGFFNTKQRRLIRKLFGDISYPILKCNFRTFANSCCTNQFGWLR